MPNITVLFRSSHIPSSPLRTQGNLHSVKFILSNELTTATNIVPVFHHHLQKSAIQSESPGIKIIQIQSCTTDRLTVQTTE